MPRFVILEHDHPVLHWDLMLETDGCLRTWRLAQAPETSGHVIDAVALPDHRLHYLDYEGPISGDRGNVKRWDVGSFAETSKFADTLDLAIAGARVRGEVRLTHCQGDMWRFQWLSG